MKLVQYPTLRIYQTLKNKNNHKEVLSHGPYLCNRSDAWLSEGYYFWDTFIENAHDWGMLVYKEKKYYIFQAMCYLSNEVCFNLCEPYFMNIFKEVVEQLSRNRISKKDMLVAEVIDYMRFEAQDVVEFHKKFIAVKAIGLKYNEIKHIYPTHLQFAERYTNDFLSLQPRVQIAIFENGFPEVKDWLICYPEELAKDSERECDKEVDLFKYAPLKENLESSVEIFIGEG